MDGTAVDDPGGGAVSSSGGTIQPDPPIPEPQVTTTEAADGEPEPDAEPERTTWEKLREELQEVPAWLWIVLAVLALRWAERNL